MASNNVAQFATELKMPADLLLTQLRSAGVEKSSASDPLSKEDKDKLLESSAPRAWCWRRMAKRRRSR